jgi:hypothetical protein
MSGIYTSRSLETASRRDINFIWLPDVVDDLFRQLAGKLRSYGEIAFENLFVVWFCGIMRVEIFLQVSGITGF